MRARQTAAVVTALAVLGLLGPAGCSNDDTPRSANSTSSRPSGVARCDAPARSVVEAAQRYVDRYAVPTSVPSASLGPTVAASSTAPAQSTEQDLQTAVTEAERILVSEECDLGRFRAKVNEGLVDIEARGSVAQAVLLQVRANLTGKLESTTGTRAVTPDDDLAQALAEVAPGSTLELTAGSYTLDTTLVVLRGVALHGAGRDRTVITSTAAQSAVLVLTDGRVDLQDLTVRRTGKEPGSVMLGGPSASVVLTRVRLTGGRADKPGEGGTGVLMSSTETTARGTTLEVTDSDFVDNDAAGIALTGGHRVNVVTSTFSRNRQCGVCFLDGSSGSVSDSAFSRNATGVAATSRAQPALRGNRFSGGQIGVQVADNAMVVLQRNRVNGASRAALVFAGRSGGQVDGTVCRDVPFGIVVARTATPFLGKNMCRVATTN